MANDVGKGVGKVWGNSRLSSSAVLCNLVLHGRLLVAIRAVVVACQYVVVDVAQADPVIALLLASGDAVLVPRHAGVDDVLSLAFV